MLEKTKQDLEQKMNEEKYDKSGKIASLDFAMKNYKIDELEKITNEKDDLFKRMSRYPEIFPMNNISYARRKNARKKMIENDDQISSNFNIDKQRDIDMNMIFKNVREWIQRSMDVIEKSILLDRSNESPSNNNQTDKPVNLKVG